MGEILQVFFYFLSETIRFHLLPRLSDEGTNDTSLRKEENGLKHKVKISVSEQPQTGGIVSCRNVTIRDRILRLFIGDRRKVMVLIPGDSVGEIAICEKGEENGQSETGD